MSRYSVLLETLRNISMAEKDIQVLLQNNWFVITTLALQLQWSRQERKRAFQHLRYSDVLPPLSALVLPHLCHLENGNERSCSHRSTEPTPDALPRVAYLWREQNWTAHLLTPNDWAHLTRGASAPRVRWSELIIIEPSSSTFRLHPEGCSYMYSDIAFSWEQCKKADLSRNFIPKSFSVTAVSTCTYGPCMSMSWTERDRFLHWSPFIGMI